MFRRIAIFLPAFCLFALTVRSQESLGTYQVRVSLDRADWTYELNQTAKFSFAVTLNNHLIAAVSVLVAVFAALPIWAGEERRQRYFFVAGCGAAFAAANELPALSFLARRRVHLPARLERRTLLHK